MSEHKQSPWDNVTPKAPLPAELQDWDYNRADRFLKGYMERFFDLVFQGWSVGEHLTNIANFEAWYQKNPIRFEEMLLSHYGVTPRMLELLEEMRKESLNCCFQSNRWDEFWDGSVLLPFWDLYSPSADPLVLREIARVAQRAIDEKSLSYTEGNPNE